MQTFLSRLILELVEKNNGDLSAHKIVFPTRRAGLFLKKELVKTASKPCWLPEVVSIEDFIHSFSGHIIPDDIWLQFRLYDVYKKYFPAESFDSFYPWGQILLRDFDEIDRYLQDHKAVFKVLKDYREIEEAFQLEEDDLKSLREFWKIYFKDSSSPLRSEFMSTWKHLSEIYSEFRCMLLKESKAYEGLSQRLIAEKILAGQNIDGIDESRKYVFAGFYALTAAEHVIVDHFIQNYRASIYWDADTWYVDQEHQEAGTFFRKKDMIKDFKWKGKYFSDSVKEVEIAGLPLMIGQAKYAGEIVERLSKGQNFNPENTAIVLPDENLLIPVLNSIPPSVERINVTMGYPIRSSPSFHLMEALISLRRNERKNGGGKSEYYFRDVMKVINHPFIRSICGFEIAEFKKLYSENAQIRIPSNRMLSNRSETFKMLFRELDDTGRISEWLAGILLVILKQQSDQNDKLEAEITGRYYTLLRNLQVSLEDEDEDVGIDTFWQLFRELSSKVRIPFSGEPLSGLQVMGFLETRVLDFENVIMLSVNEDLLPASGNKPSFIPFNIRKSFSLPTYEEQHSVSAYHFYRLLQRASKVFLVYNTESKAIAGGDVSRFIYQVEHELVNDYPENIRLTKKIVSSGVQKDLVDPIIVQGEHIAKLIEERYIQDASSDGDTGKKGLSPSAFNTYITCKLKFYFRYIAKLKEEEEETPEEIEAAGFGSILHKAMELLYKGIDELSESNINNIAATADEALDKAIAEEFASVKNLEGKNILLRKVLRELIKKVINEDRNNVPVSLLALEKPVNLKLELAKGRYVSLSGIIDRIDRRNGEVRILDYKTGNVERKKFPDMVALFTDPKYKEQFQALLYAFIVRDHYPGLPLRPGLITLKNMSQGIFFLNGDDPISPGMINEFSVMLKQLINEIMSPETSFSQTVEKDRCAWCEFKSICNRE
ncbi:MAG: PD-(D/E)XK nuclease family protein [Bacteroidetes bacterium]|nr:MAG: PD-(D/E)XK nuclease family protein [Bacteroidota bacterium]